MKQCTIKQIPIEILIMILEMMRFKDALKICFVLGIVEEMAFRYHSFYPRQYNTLSTVMLCNYVNKIYDFEKRKIVNPNLAKAMLKNVKFQSLADANDKVMFAILSQDLELVKNALKDPNGTYKARDTNSFGRYTNPFRIACNFGQFAVVKLLVNDYGIDIDNISFVYACEEGHDDIVKYIISHPKFKLDRWITDPLMQWGNTTVIRCLLAEKRFDPSLRNNQAIIEASCRGNGETVKLLLADPRVDPSVQDNLAIIMAARYAQVETVKLLLADPRVNPGDQHNQAIINAAQRDALDIVRILKADPRVNPADQNNQAIINATQRENVETYNHAIIMAARYAKVETVKLLFAHPRVINPGDQHNQAIINAAQRDALDIVRILIADPRVNPADQNNQAIINAAEQDNLEIFQLLLADPRVDPSDQNNQAVFRVVYHGNVQILKLLQSDPRVNPADQNNQAIIHAVTGESMEIVEMLLADPREEPSAQDYRAMVKVLSARNLKILKLLLLDHRVKHSKQNNQSLIDSLQSAFNRAVRYSIKEFQDFKLILEDERLDPRIRENLQIRSAIEFETQIVENSSL